MHYMAILSTFVTFMGLGLHGLGVASTPAAGLLVGSGIVYAVLALAYAVRDHDH